MPVIPTYPGVYIEEMPATARTIAGVQTAIAAFVGFTKQGPVNQAITLFNYGDYERNFGPLDPDCEVGYAVQQYFQNGGAQAIVVRCANAAMSAAVDLMNVNGGSTVLTLTADSQGDWGNYLKVLCDYDTANPTSWFNLTIQQIQLVNGQQQILQSEQHRNLSMNSRAANYAPDVINANSQLISASRGGGALALILAATFGSSETGVIAAADIAAISPTKSHFQVSVNGNGPYDVDLNNAGIVINSMATLATAIQTVVRAVKPADPIFQNFHAAVDGAGTGILMTSQNGAAGSADRERASVVVINALANNIAAQLHMGVMNGGTETEASAVMRPEVSGTSTGSLTGVNLAGLNNAAESDLTIDPGAHAVPNVVLWTAGQKPTTLAALSDRLQASLNARTEPALQRATVNLVNNALQIVAGGPDANTRITFANSGGDTTATTLNLATAAVNVAKYSLGTGATAGAQQNAQQGANGNAPTDNDLIGDQNAKTGMYALLDTDLFTILSIPRGGITGVSDAVLAAAVALAEQRRAMFVIDLPGTSNNPVAAQNWLNGHGMLRSPNAVTYFPRIMASDPMQQFRVRAFPNSGVMAGLYARTDADRGVWKAPAGIEAVLKGVSSLEYKLTDGENGVLNPLGLNCLRNFPVIGNVSWGGRTLRGADTLADQWKYLPVRRLALFLEESLFRGTQWVVFEPNDEPLWAQIRLSIGAFLNGLFRQGAFQGTTPAQAYFVKCDSETTTQADRNNGIVNIVVGFAPLKPAEFVILQIQQIASQD
jgi:phage tail sheath protein FI